MTLGNLLALWQDDLRRLLGWSSVSQAGYALMAVVVIDRADLALPSLVMFLAGYAAATVTAFAVVTELRGRTAITDYRGLGASRAWLAAALAVSLLSLVGIPPLGGFVGKLTIFVATIDGGYGWLAVVAVANTVLSLFYYLRVIAPMYLADAPTAAHRRCSAGPRHGEPAWRPWPSSRSAWPPNPSLPRSPRPASCHDDCQADSVASQRSQSARPSQYWRGFS